MINILLCCDRKVILRLFINFFYLFIGRKALISHCGGLNRVVQKPRGLKHLQKLTERRRNYALQDLGVQARTVSKYENMTYFTFTKLLIYTATSCTLI